jgi:autotransporter-associated beta strand protein
VTKTTAGTLIVAGSNGYTGATTVSAGTLRVTGSIAASSGVTVSAGATFEAAAVPAVVVKSLAIDNGGVAKVTAGVLKVGDNTNPTPLVVDGTNGNTAKVDLTNRGLIVDLPEGSDLNGALGSLRAQVIAGYAGGSWLGNGITSSTAAAATGGGVGYALASEVASGGTFMGAPADGSALVARYTLYGDSTLDGTVDFNDLVKLAQNYNTTVSGTSASWWFNGDYTYDGIVDFNDLVKLAQNYNTSLPAGAGAVPGAPEGFEGELARAMSMVPEPSAALGMLLVGLGLGRKGRRR